MDAIQMIRDDHRRVETLFRDFEEAPDAQTRKAIFDSIYIELDVHANLEEEIFYPSVQRQGEGELIRHAEEEHRMVKQLLNEMVQMDPKDATFESKFHVLKDNVQDHVAEEESEMLPKAAEVGMSRLMKLGEEMERRKQQLMTATNGQRRTATTPRRRATTTRRRTSTGRSTTARKSTTSRAKASSGARRTTSRAKSGTKASSARKTSASRARSTASGSRSTTGGPRSTARPRTTARGGSTRSKPAGRRSGSRSGASS
jgi:hemerythrin superfamily protein